MDDAVAAVIRARALSREAADHPPEPPEVPAPEVPGRAAEKHEVPRGAVTLGNAARKAGWEVEVRYARGPWLDASGEFAYVVDSVLLRMRHPADGQRAAATWVRKPTGDAEKYAYSAGHWRGELGLLKSDELRARLVHHGQDQA